MVGAGIRSSGAESRGRRQPQTLLMDLKKNKQEVSHVPLPLSATPQEKVSGYMFFILKNKLIVQGVEAWKRNFSRRRKIDAEKSF